MKTKRGRRRPGRSEPWTVAGLALVVGVAVGMLVQLGNAPEAPPAPQRGEKSLVVPPSGGLGGEPTRQGRATPVATLPLRYAPDASPEAQPILTLEMKLQDGRSGQPVVGQIWIDGMLVGENRTELDLSLRLVQPGEKAARLRVEAVGYEVWERDLRFQVLYSRRLPLVVELDPVGGPLLGDGA